MTKVEAIKRVMEDNGGTISLSELYKRITKYYPNATQAKDWTAGLRGVLYREIRNNRTFKKIGLSIYALMDYIVEEKPRSDDIVRMHSYIEGICIEIGNFLGYATYTADPSAIYRDNVKLNHLATVAKCPDFSYPEIIKKAKLIDVIWFNQKGLYFPKIIFEIVDSIGTLETALNRSLQLKDFKTEFKIVSPEKHKSKYEQIMKLEVYNQYSNLFRFVNYDDIQCFYNNLSEGRKLENKVFL
ncbi:MAG: hypothetical protein IJ566_04115 [Cardiobacteriaceae bacterium]|nr:hypothetical protein [Cardiobacteriaceae bacterium]